MKCLETRTRTVGMKYRRYLADDGHIVVTYEVPATVLRNLTSRKRLTEALERFERGERMRKRALQIKRAVLKSDEAASVLAARLGVTATRVRQIRQAALPNA